MTSDDKQQIMRIGAHVSTSGGLLAAIERTKAIGGNCMQIFSSAPQQWQGPRYQKEEMDAFRERCQKEDIGPNVIHGTYLINLASDNPELLSKSVKSYVSDLQFAHDIGAAGVIVHFGSHTGGWVGKRQALTDLVHAILDQTPEDTQFIIENSAGSGSKIGKNLEELSEMQADINHRRITFCLDTAHVFASGYDIRAVEVVNDFVSHVEKTIGWKSVSFIHATDSKSALGSKVDRHENIGRGQIGEGGFAALLSHKELQAIPWILEVPGMEGNGPDVENIEALVRLSGGV